MSTAENDLQKNWEALRSAQHKELSEGSRTLWRTLSDVTSSKEDLAAERSQEFSHQLPAEEDAQRFNRRRFLQMMGASGALIGAAGCQRRPVDHLVPYVHKPEGLTYGTPMWYSSSAANGVGVLIKTREGKPIKFEGNPDHPVTQGGLDAHSQASLLDLYHPERLKTPMTGGAELKETSWREADTQILQALKNAKPGGVRLLTGGSISPTLNSVIQDFMTTYRAKHHGLNTSSDAAILAATDRLSGQRVRPTYRFERADVIVSVDADFLGTWGSTVENTKSFSKRRKIHQGDTNVNRLFVFESWMTNTGIAADHRFAISPTQQLSVLKALIAGVQGSTAADPMVAEAVRALRAARGKSIVVAGGHGPDAIEVQVAALLLNSLLGNLGSTVDFDTPSITGFENTADVADLVADMNAGKVDVLIIHGVNPMYSAPYLKFEAAFSKVPTVVTVTSDLNETAINSKFILAESHFAECWGDSEIRSGVISIQQPVIEPIFQTRSFGECIATWTTPTAVAIDYREVVQNYWRRSVASGVAGFDNWWMDQLKVGATKRAASKKSPAFRWAAANEILNSTKARAKEDLEIVLYTSPNMGDGAQANNAYMQELPDPITKVSWTNFVAVSPATGEKLGLERKTFQNMSESHASVLSVKVNGATVELPAFVQPGIADNVVAIALGYGRTSAGTLGTKVGANASILASFEKGRLQLSGQRAEVKKTGGKALLASTQKHFDLEGRDYDILQTTTLASFLKNPKAAKEGGHAVKLMSMYSDKEFVYPEHKWGMAIDLNSCTGCQACVVACYTENNVSVVGAEEIAMGRHMAWLRLDLYYSGDPSKPETVEANYEPMLCQHCDNAPCETVCPVLATVHSTDGLNAMAYNRCVGTRYCSNNCPYKVRRFNFFQYSDQLARKLDITDPMPMMANPEVTIRTRGIMEKCTFCVQRLQRAKDDFKDRGLRVADGAVKTACQQSCAADAIAFGDLNDPKSEVSQLAAKAQAFKVLDVLNTRPNVSYLPRIRNKGAVES